MNNKQERRLTPKQQELVKRLEKIRQEKKQDKKQDKKQTVTLGRMERAPQENNQRRPRNEDVQQRQRRNEEAQQRQARQDRNEPIANKYARPQAKKVESKKISQVYTPPKRRPIKPRPEIKRRVVKKKTKKRFINQLANGQSLAQAIVLNEVLQKPVSLRRLR